MIIYPFEYVNIFFTSVLLFSWWVLSDYLFFIVFILLFCVYFHSSCSTVFFLNFWSASKPKSVIFFTWFLDKMADKEGNSEQDDVSFLRTVSFDFVFNLNFSKLNKIIFAAEMFFRMIWFVSSTVLPVIESAWPQKDSVTDTATWRTSPNVTCRHQCHHVYL